MTDSLACTTFTEDLKPDSEHYFQSLLEQAYAIGVLGDEDVQRLQTECLRLLADAAKRFHSGESSSVRVELARNILLSILFTIGVQLKTCETLQDAVNALGSEPIAVLYRKGRMQIDALLSAVKATQSQLLSRLLETPNVFYRSTLKDGINGFFKLYSPDYSAHEIHITADYPLCNPLPELAGVEFIKAYVEAAGYENQFCLNFPADAIHRLLCGHSKDYSTQPINLYEPVLTAALCCIIIGTDVYGLDLSKAGVAQMYRMTSAMSVSELASCLESAAAELIRRLDFPYGLTCYIRGSLPLIRSQIRSAVQAHIPERVFILPKACTDTRKLLIEYGSRMDDEEYRRLIEELRECRYPSDKTAIIKQQVHSLSDLQDILMDGGLNEEETHCVLDTLSLPEAAAIAKHGLIRSGTDRYLLRTQVRRLDRYLRSYLAGMSAARHTALKDAMAAIQIRQVP